MRHTHTHKPTASSKNLSISVKPLSKDACRELQGWICGCTLLFEWIFVCWKVSIIVAVDLNVDKSIPSFSCPNLPLSLEISHGPKSKTRRLKCRHQLMLNDSCVSLTLVRCGCEVNWAIQRYTEGKCEGGDSMAWNIV